MAKGKDPYSVRNQFGDDDFDILDKERYLDLLQVVSGQKSGDREAAKHELFQAHLKLVEKKIGKILKQAGANAGFAGGTGGIRDEGRSDLFNSIAGSVYGELSSMAQAAAGSNKPFILSSMIAWRVGCRVINRLRRASADKRNAGFANPEILDEVGDDALTFLERRMLSELLTELREVVESLPETERRVVLAIHYGIDSEQNLHITRVADALGMPRTTAQSAYERAIEKLRVRFASEDSEEARWRHRTPRRPTRT